MDYKIIATDFDGTLCENKWPEIGAPNVEIINYIKRQKNGGDVKLILWTCRAGDRLNEAVNWCKEQGLLFDAINENISEIIEEFGSDTRKVFAHEYIDDQMCTKFRFPFIKIETGITDEVIGKLEHTFGFPLYDWQKQYLKGEINTFPGGRGNGKTFVYCIRLLLGNHAPFDLRDSYAVDCLIDENYGPHYNRFFRDYLREANDQLIRSGFKTNAQEKKHYEESFTRFPFSF